MPAPAMDEPLPAVPTGSRFGTMAVRLAAARPGRPAGRCHRPRAVGRSDPADQRPGDGPGPAETPGFPSAEEPPGPAGPALDPLAARGEIPNLTAPGLPSLTAVPPAAGSAPVQPTPEDAAG